MFPNWNWTLIAVAVSFHSVAILSTVFRLWYRWYTARMWWDDAWVVLALLADIGFLIASVIEEPIPGDPLPTLFCIGNWIISFAYPILMWTARISILTSMVRVTRPEGVLKQVAVGTGVLFGILGAAMIGARIQVCVTLECLITRAFLIAQIATDCIGDILLSALPILFLRNMNLKRQRKVLVSSIFSASMVINIVTVVETVAFFQSVTSGSIIFEHVKVACSVIVCNLLVIVTFVYRILHRGDTDPEESQGTSRVVFTSAVDLAQKWSGPDISRGKSLYTLPESTRSSTRSFTGGDTSGSVAAAMPGVDVVPCNRSIS